MLKERDKNKVPMKIIVDGKQFKGKGRTAKGMTTPDDKKTGEYKPGDGPDQRIYINGPIFDWIRTTKNPRLCPHAKKADLDAFNKLFLAVTLFHEAVHVDQGGMTLGITSTACFEKEPMDLTWTYMFYFDFLITDPCLSKLWSQRTAGTLKKYNDSIAGCK